jgi:hypothetical protein
VSYPAPFPAPPQVVDSGGPVLSAPQIYPVFFSNDDPATVASLADFSLNIGSTAYWTATTSEYGVGPATGGPAIQLSQAAPGMIDDSQIQTWIAQQVAASVFPTPNMNTMLVLYYPTGTTITLQGATSCQTFGGYHNSATVNGQQVAYAVVPRCGNLDQTTGDASHEMIEAATDPFPMVNPAYAQVDEGDLIWQLIVGGGEVGDMCAQFPSAFTKFPPFNYTVQRTWSNKAALAGHDPCQPELPGEVYFSAAPVLPDMVATSIQGQNVMLKAVHIPVGGSRTIDLDLYSDGPVAPWTVSATGAGNNLNLSLNTTTGKNGDVLQLTIKVLSAGQGNIEAFIIKSTSTSQPQHGDWFGVVGN